MSTWKTLPITDKQRKLIMDMQEFSEYPLPEFKGTTRGEASDYIDQWLAKSHESMLDCWETTQGFD